LTEKSSIAYMNTYSHSEEIMEDTCLCKMIDANVIASIVANVPNSNTIAELSNFFSVFADPSRLKLLYYLSQHELCVADLASLSDLRQSAVSHQLKILRLNRLVRYRREGTTLYYSLDDAHIQSVFEIALQHVNEERSS
jgi:ArsR family transcriptional regulator, lead/cadmium/zinc/bismuth-responsive transcriptional repressor